MIIGIGADICLITRLKKVIDRYDNAFLNKIFLPEERAYVEGLSEKLRFGGYAKRWAAKEACAKALGTGFSQGIQFRDIRVTLNERGAPGLMLSGKALVVLNGILPKGYESQLFLTMSDDTLYALAHVVIEALPGKQFVK